MAEPFFSCSSNVGTRYFLSAALYSPGFSGLAFEHTTRRYAGVPAPVPAYIVVCINKSSCLVDATCPARGGLLRSSSSTFNSPAMLVDDQDAPCVYPSGVCTTCSKVGQLMMLPSAAIFCATGMKFFSVSSAYCAQFARGI